MPISQKDYLDALTNDVLRDLARNESASHAMRLEAVRLLVERKSVHVKHDDLRELLSEVESTRQEVVDIVETAIEAPFPQPEHVPFSAEAVAAGYWEVYHDDDCDGVVTPYPENLCLKCGMHPDLQSRGARRTEKSAPEVICLANPALRASFTTQSM